MLSANCPSICTYIFNTTVKYNNHICLFCATLIQEAVLNPVGCILNIYFKKKNNSEFLW